MQPLTFEKSEARSHNQGCVAKLRSVNFRGFKDKLQEQFSVILKLKASHERQLNMINTIF